MININRALRIGSRINHGVSGSVLFVDNNLKLAQDNSDLFWDAVNKRLGINTNSPTEKLDIVGNAIATGYISGKKSGVFAYLASPANTTITTAGTYYPIAGTFTNAPIEDFTAVATPAIRYDGAKTQYFEIDWHASGYGDSNGQTIHIGIKKNGVLCTGGVMGTFLKFLGEEQALSGTCVIELATNETIQLVITSDTNGDVITMEHFTTTITEFFD